MNTTYTTAEPTTSLVSNNPLKATVTLNAEQSLVQVSWTGAPTPSELAACANEVSAIIKQHQITQLLHDVRLVDYTNIDLQRCLTHVFCPQVLAAGATKIVHLANYVLPDLLVIDQITACVKQKYGTDRNTKFEICTTPEGATEWFKYCSFPKAVIVTQEQAAVKVAKTATLNEVFFLNTLVLAYKEKAAFMCKILFKSKALSSNL